MPVSASVSSLRITYFQADKLHHASGAGRGGFSSAQRQSSPYRVTTYRGPELGLVGSLPAVLNRLHEIDAGRAANQSTAEEAQGSFLQKLKRHCLMR